jgi:hypothetical protein
MEILPRARFSFLRMLLAISFAFIANECAFSMLRQVSLVSFQRNWRPSPTSRPLQTKWRMPHLCITAIISKKVRPLRVSRYLTLRGKT